MHTQHMQAVDRSIKSHTNTHTENVFRHTVAMDKALSIFPHMNGFERTLVSVKCSFKDSYNVRKTVKFFRTNGQNVWKFIRTFGYLFRTSEYFTDIRINISMYRTGFFDICFERPNDFSYGRTVKTNIFIHLYVSVVTFTPQALLVFMCILWCILKYCRFSSMRCVECGIVGNEFPTHRLFQNFTKNLNKKVNLFLFTLFQVLVKHC